MLLCGGLAISAATGFLLKQDEISSLSGFTMGTSYNIQLVDAPSVLNLENLALQIQQKLDYLDQELMSTYAENSQLSRFNRGPLNKDVSVAPELSEVVAQAIEIYHLSNHAFDITVGPLVNLWGFGPNGIVTSPPLQREIDAARAMLGSDTLIVSQAPSTLHKSQKLELDLSAIAKGYAVDQIALLLKQQGLTDFLVEIGGELLIQGTKPDNEPWTLGIEFPSMQSPQQSFQTINSHGNSISIASSGDYRNYFDADGQHFSHEIDPVTGRPVTHDLVSVTVIANTSIRADALATTFMIMGPEEGFAFASREMIAVYFIIETDSGFVSRFSDEFSKYIDKQEAHDKE